MLILFLRNGNGDIFIINNDNWKTYSEKYRIIIFSSNENFKIVMYDTLKGTDTQPKFYFHILQSFKWSFLSNLINQFLFLFYLFAPLF